MNPDSQQWDFRPDAAKPAPPPANGATPHHTLSAYNRVHHLLLGLNPCCALSFARCKARFARFTGVPGLLCASISPDMLPSPVWEISACLIEMMQAVGRLVRLAASLGSWMAHIGSA